MIRFRALVGIAPMDPFRALDVGSHYRLCFLRELRKIKRGGRWCSLGSYIYDAVSRSITGLGTIDFLSL